MQAVIQKIGDRPGVLASTGPKGPPSAPPTIPPIIINPFHRESPSPAIDPRHTPAGPPLRPPPGPGWRCIRAC